MASRQDFIEIQTLNNGPECYNIGNLWPKQNTNYQPSVYMESHVAWQPPTASFIQAWKAGGSVSSIVPVSGGDGSGAMWYRSLPMDAVCAWDGGVINGSTTLTYYEKPVGFDAAKDTVNWAIVVPAANAGGTISVSSAGETTQVVTTKAGLNYGTSTKRYHGAQSVQLTGPAGNVLMTATGGECVYNPGDCDRGIYNMNYEVLGFASGAFPETCTENSNDNSITALEE